MFYGVHRYFQLRKKFVEKRCFLNFITSAWPGEFGWVAYRRMQVNQIRFANCKRQLQNILERKRYLMDGQ